MSGWIASAGGGLLALMVVLYLAVRVGRSEERRRSHEKAVDMAREARAIDEAVARLDRADVDRRLRDAAAGRLRLGSGDRDHPGGSTGGFDGTTDSRP